jgi:putative ABC transport system permease protein
VRVLSRFVSLWNTLFRKQRLDRDLDDELRCAVETLTDRHLERGMDASAARRAALAEFGGEVGMASVRKEVRDGRIGASMDAMVLDFRYAWRALSKVPALAAIIVLTLALGIGANTAIFSVVHAMLLEPLPYRDADRLLFVWLDRSDVGYPRGPLSWPDLKDLREGSRTCASFGGIWATGTVALTGNGDPEQLRAALVTTNFFNVLGAEAALGRTFRPEDGARGAAPTVLLGWDLFERRFGGDPSIVGRRIRVNNEATTVIGVMPKAFRLLLPMDSSVPDRLQVWQPLFSEVETWPRGSLFLRVVARMRPTVTIAEAREDIASIADRISREVGTRRAFTTVGLQADDVREIRAPLLALFAGVGILLMIGCVNVAGLLIARAASRAKETALRLALGASRGRLLRQSLIEGLLLTLLGAVAGLLVGYAGLRMLIASTPETLSRLESARVDLPVFAFTLGVSILWGLLFSLAPTIELFRTDPSRTLSSGGSRSASLPVRYRTRTVLVVVQIALSVVLLVGAGLLVRTFAEIQRVDPGFRSEQRLTFRVAIPGNRYEGPDAISAAMTELQRRIASLPSVTSVGAISHLPYDDLPNWGLTYALEGPKPKEGAPFANTRAITPGLLETMGARLIDGRFFTEHDRTPLVIIDDILARRLWPGRSAVGQPLMIGQGEPDRRVSVIGVVRHLNLRSVVDDLIPQIYVPYRVWQRSPMAFVVGTDGISPGLVREIRSAVAAFDPQLPIFDVRLLGVYVESARSIRRFTMWLAVAFAGTALLLTCIGVYGVLAYAVTTRRHEFGVRRALGADTRQVIREVLGEGVRFAAVGCLGGVVGAAIAARLLHSQLYAVEPRDPITYATAVSIILGGAVVACWIPAHRATTISPMDALRAE